MQQSRRAEDDRHQSGRRGADSPHIGQSCRRLNLRLEPDAARWQALGLLYL